MDELEKKVEGLIKHAGLVWTGTHLVPAGLADATARSEAALTDEQREERAKEE